MFLFLQACEKQEVTSAISHNDDLSMASPDKPQNFVSLLSGNNEVPPVNSKATGQVKLKVSKDGMEIHYKLIVANIDNVRFSHIHNAPVGVNGQIVAFLYPGPTLASFNGVLAEGVITKDDLIGPMAGQEISDLVAAIKARNTYVNVHTDAFPPGEIRGQIK